MKLLAALCLVVVVAVDSAPAAACSPPLTCGLEYCFTPSGGPPDAVIEGVLVEANGSGPATIDVTAVAGAPELPIGEATLSLDPSFSLFEDQVGETVLLYVRRAPDGELFATQRIERAVLDQCFTSNDIAVADLATIVMSSQCHEELDANEEPFEGCDDTAGCSAGGGTTGGLVLLAFSFGLCVTSRRRRHTHAAR